MMPSLAAGMPSFAVGAATRRSHATASCMPAPERDAVDRGDDRRGIVRDRVEHELERGTEGVATAVLEPAGVLGPSQDVGTRAERDACTGDDDGAQTRGRGEVPSQLVTELRVERVAALGPVDRRQADVLLGQLPTDHGVGSLSSRR